MDIEERIHKHLSRNATEEEKRDLLAQELSFWHKLSKEKWLFSAMLAETIDVTS